MLLLLTWIVALNGYAQSTNLNGTINTVLSAVTAINTGTNSMTLSTPAGFSIGDSVLIIQMKGATMNSADAATFGDVTAVNGAGLYEINIVCNVVGSEITLERNLLNTYAVAGHVQMVQIPSYPAVVVNGALTAPTWDGTKGGVLVFSSSEWVRLDADIDMSGKGFRAGWDFSNYTACNCGCGTSTQFPAYFYPMGSCRAGDKGEGIADSVATKEFGKGKETTGGGAGNDHNAGGAGGGNYGVGGNGGITNNQTCAVFGAYCRGLNAGVGGLSLNAAGLISNAQNRLFLGGGGGAGHDNNGTGTAGRAGGGLIIIIADSLHMNGRSIISRGLSHTAATASTSDGAGGGGAGGTVVLKARVIQNVAGIINVGGGNGGNDNWASPATGCKGPGGGGGGGLIWSNVALPGLVTTVLTGGLNGTNCAGASGSQPGGAGGTLTGLNLAVNSSTYLPCVLPVEYSYFSATPEGDAGVQLAWGTATEQRNRLFHIERSSNGQQFSSISTVHSSALNGQGSDYSYFDASPSLGANYYRLKQVDQNGGTSYSEVRMVVFGQEGVVVGNVYPNPAPQRSSMFLDIYASGAGVVTLRIHDIAGRLLGSQEISLDMGNHTLELPVSGLSAGSYLLELRSAGQAASYRRFSIGN